MRTRRRDHGAATVELAILAPAVIAFFLIAVITGRYTLALQASEAAAYDAARSASLARTAAAARTAGTNAAASSFASQDITCRSLTVAVDTTGFAVPVGQPATVRVTVTCVADFSDIAIDGMPGSATLTASFISPLDTYRTRT